MRSYCAVFPGAALLGVLTVCLPATVCGDQGPHPATYTPRLPAAGVYEVFAWWNSRGSRYHPVPYVVHHADGSQTVTVDQNKQGGRWVSLGRYRFGDEGASVELRADSLPGYVVAEAVRFVPEAEGIKR